MYLILTLGHDDFGYDIEQREIISSISFPQAIESLDYNIRKFSSSLGYCHHADNHLISQENYEAEYLLNMMRLNFTVVSLESIVYRFFGGNHNCRKKILINIERENININFIEKFSHTIKLIQSNFNNEFYFDEIFDLSKIKDTEISYNLALEIIYTIRNKFLHGLIAIPLHIEDEKQKENELRILKLSQELLLYFIQILLYINYKDQYSSVQWEGEEFPLEVVMKNLHIDITEWDC